MRENREKFYGLLLHVRVFCVLRGSCFQPIVMLTAKGAKTAKVLGSVSPCSCRSCCSRFMFLTGVSAINLTAKHAKIANKKGSVPSRFKAVQGRVQEEVYPPSREGTESREGRRGPCSCRSRCSRFKFLNRSVRCDFGVKI